ncbi:MAG: T9SS type A sorting domain-containing protein [Bacteroidota bacterium]
MKTLYLLFLLLMTHIMHAGWIDLNTGINDELKGVVFWGNNGVVCGDHGLYYTTTGGSGASSWTRYAITGNAADAAIYDRTKFTHIYADPTAGTNKSFACGYDTVLNKAMIMSFNLSTLNYSFVYTGTVNSKLNEIGFCSSNQTYYAVGNNGLIVAFPSAGTTYTLVANTQTADLKAISFLLLNFCIATDNSILKGYITSGVFTFIATTTENNHYKDIIYTSSNTGYALGTSYYKWAGSFNLTDYPNYDFGPLKGNGLINYTSCNYVGTDHGIFKSSSTMNFLEWQPSSGNYHINNFWYETSASTNFYACGKNGVVLKTTDQGGATKPIALITNPNGCVNTTYYITGITGSSNNCQWFVDGVLSSTSCGSSFTKTYSTPGTHTIQVNVANSWGLYDTTIKVIQIFAFPKKNIPYSVQKKYLCHQEPLVISLDTAEQNVVYTLKKYGSGANFGSSPSGVNAALTFTTLTLTQSGNYYLQASCFGAPCTSNFTDTIKVVVEKTKAEFHCSNLNALPGEQNYFYENSTEAQNFKWEFSSTSGISYNFNANPIIPFSANGPTSVELVVWSNHGCYDSITKKGPTIYTLDPSGEPDCWTILNKGTDNQFVYCTPGVGKLAVSKKGFFMSTSVVKDTIVSRYGDSVVTSVAMGCLVKYTPEGIVKWMVASKGSSPLANGADLLYDVAEDKHGNVYLTGSRSGTFFDNAGDSIVKNASNYIIKLDSMGRKLWDVQSQFATFKAMAIDNSGNLIVTSVCGGNFTVSLNSAPPSTVQVCSSCGTTFLKLDTDGNIIWNAGYALLSSGTTNNVAKVTVDGNNNIYITGCFSHHIDFYSVANPVPETIWQLPNTGGARMYLVKYDSLGQLIWTANSFSQVSANDFTLSYDMVTDSTGNCYIAGANDHNGFGTYQVFNNSDNTTMSSDVGKYFVAKINSNGICKWIQGNRFSYYGYGFGINLYQDEVSVIGSYGENALNTHTVTFTGINDTIPFSLDKGDCFIAVYDTMGNIKKVTRNGDNGGITAWTGSHSIIRNSTGDYYIARNFRFYTGFSNMNNFGTSIHATNNWDGCITKLSDFDCGLTSYPGVFTNLDEEKLAKELFIYPNPSHCEINISSGKDIINGVKIFDAKGSLVLSVNYNDTTAQKMINVSSLTQGLYFIQIQSQKHNATYKFIKE